MFLNHKSTIDTKPENRKKFYARNPDPGGSSSGLQGVGSQTPEHTADTTAAPEAKLIA